jgi:hypothetical protein
MVKSISREVRKLLVRERHFVHCQPILKYTRNEFCMPMLTNYIIEKQEALGKTNRLLSIDTTRTE